MGQAIIRLSELSVESFVTSGVNNNYLVFSPLPYSKQNSSGIDGHIQFNGIVANEIVEADLDVALANPSTDYAFSVGTDNKIKLTFDKSLHASKAEALVALKNVEVVYELGNLKLDGANYSLIARDSTGEEIHRTTPVTLEQATQIISTLDMSRDFNSDGFIRYELVHNFIVT
ncbi:hypothetical protein EDM57_05185 [Brevibacillus gelatini]|uniref:Uncharacterized protein n=1 Tax=Brevibacillus gelatini TaxID=1655277 RepID=A0A3M8B980_9BACL|nr:hypothetical protein [Brevibacillus gelatini]RNB59537.1 hypothetical protein EDM57_05185 [Brevibacillus gelatini]